MQTLNEVKVRLSNWSLLKLSEDEQLSWLRDNLAVRILQAWESGDRVEAFIVPTELSELVEKALKTMCLPVSFADPSPAPEDYSRDKVESDFAAFCTTVLVRNADLEQFAVPETTSELVQFIRPVTAKAKENMFLQNWDEAVGLTNSLRQKGVPLMPSMGEKRLIFLLLHVMEQLGQSEANKIKPAAESNLFKP